MKANVFLLPGIVITMALGTGACETASTNANMPSSATPAASATPRPEPTAATGRGQYTEEQARQERERAKRNSETIGQSLDDAWIHTKIVAKLIGDKTTPERNINVDVMNGIVTLRGNVETMEARAEAERVAKDTEGVSKVVNQLKVAAPKTGNSKKTVNANSNNEKKPD
jgi:osmotically-inducible protein OsmY